MVRRARTLRARETFRLRPLDIVRRGSGLIAACLIVTASSAPLSARQIELEEVLRFGVLQGDPSHEFGLIQSVVGSRDGHVFVLDSRMHTVRAFDPSGRFIARFGRPGSGPNEFRAPLAMKLSTDDDLIILDPANARLNVARYRDGALIGAGSIPIPLPALDFCVLGDRIFLLGYREERIIHEIDRAGTLLRSFGTPPDAAGPFAASILTGGHLDCLPGPDGGRIVHAGLVVPIVASYTPDGRREWSTELEDFEVVEVTVDRGRVTQSAPRGFIHMIASTTPVNVRGQTAAYIVQYGRQVADVTRPEEMAELQSVLLDRSDGRVIARTTALPRLSHVTADRIFSFENLPYPRVIVYSTVPR